jgi:Tfp pilus assembly protein PilO
VIWREKRILLAVLGILLAANVVFFFTYRVQYENRLRELDSRLDTVKNELQAAKQTRAANEQQLAAYRQTEKDVRSIYDSEWSTEEQRLTAFIAEVQKIGAATQLVPTSLSLSHNAAVKTTARAATATASEVGINFSVAGKYEQVRRLINLLEVSDQFVIIDQIGLASESGENLNVTIRVKTLFRPSAGGGRAPNQEL